MHKRFFTRAGAALMAAAMAVNGAVITTAVNAADSVKYEFEDAVFTGTIATDSDADASGGKVAFMKDDGVISVSVNAASAGMYDLTIYAKGEGGSKIQNLGVNGVDQGQISIGEDGYNPVSMTVKLNEGENTVTITKSWGWTKFDYLTVEAATLPEIKATQTTCCDISASAETRSLMAYLASVYGNGIISGQQEIYSNGPHGLEYEFEYLNDLTGHYPAIRGFDYGNFCCPAFGSDDGSTERVIDWVKNKNGIATSSFHLNVPKDFESYKIGDRIDWAVTTYGAKDTDFSPSKAATEGTKENEYYMQALTTLAKEFNELEEQGVPVIWRPLHEAEGGGGETGSWFWWGREGSEAYKKLWIYTYKTLTEKFGCHNLIWEWNSYNYEYSQDWYPGDEYVDIIGYDKYNCTDWSTGSPVLKHNDSAISSTFYGIMNKYDSAKMVSMAENDCFSTVDNLMSEKAGWLYFCTWYDGGSDDTNFLTNPTFNTKEDTIAMYQSDYCITLDELPADLYKKDIKPIDPALTTTKATTAPPVTTTKATTEADPNKDYGKVVFNKTTKNYKITLPEAAEDFYINVELPDGVTYANGGLGVTVPLDGEYYWVNIQWEAKQSGAVKVNVFDNFLNCSLGTEVVEDEALIEKIKAQLGTSKEYEGQIWYAAKGETALTDTSGVKIIDAYLMKDDTTTVTTTPAPSEPVDVTLLGDANCDGQVTIADSTAILQALGNPDKYGLSAQGAANADCCDPGDGVLPSDALAIQKIDAKVITKLPEITAEK
ncbi:MAG: glycoside hydrolase [Ruminococcus sp.]|nr:glycoside hydrolase [Ruminococcus sp.]